MKCYAFHENYLIVFPFIRLGEFHNGVLATMNFNSFIFTEISQSSFDIFQQVIVDVYQDSFSSPKSMILILPGKSLLIWVNSTLVIAKRFYVLILRHVIVFLYYIM